jgi:hypothetical protein
MFRDPLVLIVVVAVMIVAVILLVGIGGFSRGGEFNRKHANRIMRYRVGAQAVAIVVILIVVAIRQARGG